MTVGKRLEEFAVREYRSIAKLNKKIQEKHGKKVLLYKFVNDKALPGYSAARALAELGCDLNWLFVGAEKKEVTNPNNEQLEAAKRDVLILKAQLGILTNTLTDLIQMKKS